MPELSWTLRGLSSREEVQRARLTELLSQAGWRFGDRASAASSDVAMVWANDRLSSEQARFLQHRLEARRPILLLGRTVTSDLSDEPILQEASGIVPRAWMSPHPARLRPEGAEGWAQRVAPLDGELELVTSVLTVDKQRDSVESWVTAPVGLSRQPVVTWNPDAAVGVFAAAAEAASADSTNDLGLIGRLLHLVLRRIVGVDPTAAPRPLSVGLLGFGAIGAEHARAIVDLPGLDLSVVCDRNEERLAQASLLSPDVTVTTDARSLLEGDADLIVVSTPPDTHAEWATRMMAGGKDVIVEKPFALTTDEADHVIDDAHAQGRRVVTYQNRRYDPDFLAVRNAIGTGRIGDLFHLETFVGGYGHPCNYWHSDEEVSGGAIYDWGSHVLDQILQLHPAPIAHVTAIEHKRKWLDVTNADHTSLHIRFKDGVEASFTHSDLASALKPRWLALGTEGALSSRWRAESVIARTEIGTLHEDRLAATDSPPDVFLHGIDGSETTLVLPTPPTHPFHRELVDDLLFGWPMSVTAGQSRRVVAVMEAARASAQSAGEPVEVDGEL
ncbi:MAG TPA: Gfo/Idh/MocA family oxidoreductase [Actinomycetes bacterium]|nr:Gfo/Idh/MocA family oxidoreductase [Actinomycetes bacterium]